MVITSTGPFCLRLVKWVNLQRNNPSLVELLQKQDVEIFTLLKQGPPVGWQVPHSATGAEVWLCMLCLVRLCLASFPPLIRPAALFPASTLCPASDSAWCHLFVVFESLLSRFKSPWALFIQLRVDMHSSWLVGTFEYISIRACSLRNYSDHPGSLTSMEVTQMVWLMVAMVTRGGCSILACPLDIGVIAAPVMDTNQYSLPKKGWSNPPL